jgi:hypothetical protein
MSKTGRDVRVYMLFACFFSVVAIFDCIRPSFVFSAEPVIVQDIRKKVEHYGYEIAVEIVNNRETGREDLFVTPKKGGYSSGAFIFAVAHGISDATSISLTYQVFFDMVLIQINDELWAISAANCRRIFSLQSAEEQNKMFRKSLKRLR